MKDSYVPSLPEKRCKGFNGWFLMVVKIMVKGSPIAVLMRYTVLGKKFPLWVDDLK